MLFLWDTRLFELLGLNGETSRGLGVEMEHFSLLELAPTDSVSSTVALFCSEVDGGTLALYLCTTQRTRKTFSGDPPLKKIFF